jgi:hypothetical protein
VPLTGCPAQIGGRMAEDGADMDALMRRMDALQTQIDAADGWELERQLERATEALRCPPGAPARRRQRPPPAVGPRAPSAAAAPALACCGAPQTVADSCGAP